MPSKQDSSRATIIFSMIDGGNMSYIIQMTEYFINYNFNALLYDYLGFGKSQDFNIERDMLIYAEFLKDLDTAVNFVKPKNDDLVKILIAIGADNSDQEIYIGRSLLHLASING